MNIIYIDILTDRTKGRFLKHREATIMNGEMTYVEPEKNISLQLGQGVMPEPKIEYHDVRSSLQHDHGLRDVLQVSDLAHNIQAGFLYAAITWRDLAVWRTDLRRLR